MIKSDIYDNIKAFKPVQQQGIMVFIMYALNLFINICNQR